jgi:predicted Zn-dependent protease
VKAKAEAASRKALELDPTLAQAHDTAGAINLFFEWNWKVADEESRLAASMDPDSALHHHLRAYVLTATQHLDEALEEAKKASQLAPFQHPFGLGVALLNARRYDAAIEELRLRKEAQPSDLTVRFNLAKCYHLKGMEKESVMEIAEAYEQAGNKRTAAAIREAFRNGGAKAVAQWRLNDLKTEARKRYISPRTFALAYASLGMREETLKSLEAAYEERAPFLVFLQSDPDFDFLHSDKRYRAIIDKMGLPPAY